MPVTDDIEGAGKLIKSVGAFLALLPGAAVLIGLVELPGSVATLVKFLSNALGIVIILAILLANSAVRRMKGTLAAALLLLFGAGAAATLSAYMIFAEHHLMAAPEGTGGPIAIPDQLSPELATLMEPYGGDYAEALMTSSQRDKIRRLMDKDSSASILKMIALLLLGQLSLVFAIGLGAWKLAERQRTARRPRAGSNR